MSYYEAESRINIGYLLIVPAVLTGWFIDGATWPIVSALLAAAFIIGTIQTQYQKQNPKNRSLRVAMRSAVMPALLLAPIVVLAVWGGFVFLSTIL